MDKPKTDLRTLARHLAGDFGKKAPRADMQEYDRFAQFDDALSLYAQGLMEVNEGIANEPVKVVPTRSTGGAWSNG